MSNVVIGWAKRTPIGKVGGTLKSYRPEKMAAALIRQMQEETGIQGEKIQDVMLGNVVGPGGNIARLSALNAGIPVNVPGVTIDRQCGSGLAAIELAFERAKWNEKALFLCGGTESVSQAPWKMEKPSRPAQELPVLFERARFSPDEIGDPEMGEAAENVARTYQVSREIQDEFAYKSQQKAVRAQKEGRFEEEIVPLGQINEDECPRANISMRKLKRMPAVFQKNGTVTAGNACPINDGAALAVVTNQQQANNLGLDTRFSIVDSCTVGVDPNLLGIGPVPAVRALLERNNLHISDIEIMEFNEAFASQVVASIQEMGISWDRVNLGGGAIALGHPYGASGAVLIVRLLKEMEVANATLGIATLGIGGGMGTAMLVEQQK
ncbi:thiolase family protein [Salicibibacter cibarius]|uniref:Acetoacetyl-CoA thiolase n=1 Tax=Salicibibacter cibarius TaxID=2743000 RepID=A0A7T7CBP2_9BACI|nr:thiolase family protein [Salicibibacter cibarius]QQK76199.1 thiolase family protein [Salicibibacter cibarius]